MENKPFLSVLYRHYFEHGGRKYLFVAMEGRTSIIGRLYGKNGLYNDFEVPIDSEVHSGLSSNSPVNPFDRYIRSAKYFLDAIDE